MRRAVLADDNPAIGRSLFNLASLEHNAASYRAAEPLYEEALLRMRRSLRAGAPPTWSMRPGGWAGTSSTSDRAAEAERNLRWALVGDRTRTAGRRPRDTLRFGRFLVTLLVDQRRWKEAEPLALRVLAIQDSLQDTLARVTAGQLATIYDATGRKERAEQYRARLSP